MPKGSYKVKDLVSARPFRALIGNAADAGTVVESYKFTPLTSDLMSSWISHISGVSGITSRAFAIAGRRGVGKSHFLSLLSVLCGDSGSRALLSDELVRKSCEAFGGAEFKVIRVYRGSDDDLRKELKNAAEKEFRSDLGSSAEIEDILRAIVDTAGGQPAALIIDSNPGREKRITRDDGPDLAAIADTARELGIFVGIALDDDISGADGPNVQVAEKYVIDYLDPTHLYQIVDSFVFPKNEGLREELIRIYSGLRSTFPSFRWSEERFASLYPLHPESLDIAPFVRYYVPDFALLGFAADAAVKIMGRPAESLIGLDEMYDAVESRLRTHDELAETFRMLDQIDKDVLDGLPLAERYPARLAFKYLILRSLSGSPATVNEINAGVMIENTASSPDLEELLSRMSELEDAPIKRYSRPDGLPAYLLEGVEVEREVFEEPADAPTVTVSAVNASDNTTSDALADLLRFVGWHFSDLDGDKLFSAGGALSVLEWNNTFRRGRIAWHEALNGIDIAEERLDWRIVVVPQGIEAPRIPADDVHAFGIWRLPPLSPDESLDVARYTSSASERTTPGDPAVRSNAIDESVEQRKLRLSIERILKRVLIEDASFEIDGKNISFTEDDLEKHTLAYLFSPLFEAPFRERLAEHPSFAKTVGTREFSALVSKYFVGAEADSPDVRQLVEAIAVPLGLAEKHGEGYKPASLERLAGSPITAPLIDIIDSADDRTMLTALEDPLYAAPLGLSLEARQLVITALVAAMDLEFVTNHGSRIGTRSLDLQIVWDDIIGVAKPSRSKYDAAKVAEWCHRLFPLETGQGDGSTRQLNVGACLRGWYGEWQKRELLSRFESLPAESLTLNIWRTGENVRRSFGRASSAIEAWLDKGTSEDDCMAEVIDCFRDSGDVYSSRQLDAAALEAAIEDKKRKRSTIGYLTYSHLTEDAAVEQTRLEAMEVTDAVMGAFDDVSIIEQPMYAFKKAYAEYYFREHEIKRNCRDELRGAFSASVGQDWWAVFTQAAALPWFDESDRMVLADISAFTSKLFCDSNTETKLDAYPLCECAFDPELLPPISADNVDTFVARAMDRLASNTIDALGSLQGEDEVVTVRDQMLSDLSSGENVEIDVAALEVLKAAAAKAFDEGVA